jgi:hypothetical protein
MGILEKQHSNTNLEAEVSFLISVYVWVIARISTYFVYLREETCEK